MEKILYDDGTLKYFYGHSKSEVLKKISDYERTSKDGLAFTKVADEWMEYAEPNLSNGTLKGYRPALKRAEDRFGDIPINKIAPLDISRFLFDEAANMAEKTCKTQRLVVNRIMVYAVNKGYLDRNPCRDVEIPQGLPKRKRTAASEEDIKKIKAYPQGIGLMFLMALCTGMRRGELLALEWDDIDLENRTISVTKNLQRNKLGKMEIKSTKTEAGERVIPISDSLYPFLHKDEGLVFSNKGKYWDERGLSKAISAWKKKSGVECTLHQLRHSFATYLYTNDVSVQSAKALMGHSSITMTMDTYAELSREKARQIKEEFGRIQF